MKELRAKKTASMLPLAAEVRETTDLQEAINLMNYAGWSMVGAAQGGNGQTLYCLIRCDMHRAARLLGISAQTTAPHPGKGGRGSRGTSAQDRDPVRKTGRSASTRRTQDTD